MDWITIASIVISFGLAIGTLFFREKLEKIKLKLKMIEDLLHTVNEALADGKITEKELKTIIQQIQRLLKTG